MRFQTQTTRSITPFLFVGLSSLLHIQAAPIPDSTVLPVDPKDPPTFPASVVSAWRPAVQAGGAGFLPAEFTVKSFQAIPLLYGKGTLLDATQVLTLTDSAAKPTKTVTMEYVQIVNGDETQWEAKAEIVQNEVGQGKYEAAVLQGCAPAEGKAACVGQSMVSGSQTTAVYSNGKFEQLIPVPMTSAGPLATFMNDKFGKKPDSTTSTTVQETGQTSGQPTSLSTTVTAIPTSTVVTIDGKPTTIETFKIVPTTITPTTKS